MSLITAEDVAKRVRATMVFTDASPMAATRVFYGRRPPEQAAPYVVLSVGEAVDPIRESDGVAFQRFAVTLTGWVKDPAFTATMATVIRSWMAPLLAAGSTGWPSGTTMQDVYPVAPGADDLRIDDRPIGGEDVVATIFKAIVVVTPQPKGGS